ncbi:MAG: hypothetical protein MI747_20665 [Desulfobacterales bacterium]|nr:hypothetical protein [Desulfobacterales bacterium]
MENAMAGSRFIPRGSKTETTPLENKIQILTHQVSHQWTKKVQNLELLGGNQGWI